MGEKKHLLTGIQIRPRERTGAVGARDGRNRDVNGQNYPQEARQARACRTPAPDTANRTGDGAPLSPCPIKY